ncbi:hypothetical protein BDZ89DRAFT_1060751 [Hymenopellis radicata]|nr:hypothetical protein BDZ89DRAFT_1060751 [Hymenopellis radicata]
MGFKFEGVVITEADVQDISRTTLHSMMLFLFCHAVHTCIFGAALYYIASNKGGNRRRIIFASIVTFLWLVETVIVAFQWEFVDDAFVFSGHSAASTELRFNKFRDGLPGTTASYVLRGLCTFLADLILIWHCYMLYGRSWKVASLPSLCLGFETISFAILVSLPEATDPIPGVNWVKWVVICYSMTVVTNGLCTSLILSHIVWVNGVSASLRTDGGIIEIFIQSAALYSAVQVAVLVVYAYEFYAPDVRIVSKFIYPQVLSCSITGIAPTLIIARIMAGKGRPKDPSTSNMLSVTLTESMRFASGPPYDTHRPGHATTDIALEEITRFIRRTSGEEVYAWC